MNQSKKQQSLRQQILIATVLFSTTIAIIVSLFFFMLSSYYTKQTKLQSIEFNLTLVASTIQTSLSNAEQLLNWSANTSTVRTYLTSSDCSPELVLRTYDTVNAKYSANQAQQKIERFFMTDETTRFLQFGMSVNTSQTLDNYTVDRFPFVGNDKASYWNLIEKDPLIPSHPDGLIAYTPIVQGADHTKIGSAYIALDLSVITDPLQGYVADQNSTLYWRNGDSLWKIKDTVLQEIDTTLWHTQAIANEYDLAPSTSLQEIENNGQRYWLVTCPLPAGGLSVSQRIPVADLRVSSQIYALSILGSLFFIAIMSTLLLYWLNGTISQPIIHLRHRLSTVGQGDFTADPSIEWNSELGDIGRGINLLASNVDNLMTRRLEDQRQHQELEYRMLQNEINPHFIYNTLNGIRWMATIQHATGIAEMVTSLSRLLKSISKSNEKLVCLRDELTLLNDYFLIQQYRYGGDLEMDVSYIEDEAICQNCYIPRFTLQPIAENAIFHGLEPAGGIGSILLDIRYDGDDVLIHMKDNGAGMSKAQCLAALAPPTPEQAEEKFRHVGLWNVHKRIQYSFGEPYGISLNSMLGEGTTVTIRLPYTPKQKEV